MGSITPNRIAEELGAVSPRRYPFVDPGLAVEPPIICEQPDDVAEVRAEEGYRLFVRFFDGTCGYVDLKERVQSKDARAFAFLADSETFKQVGIGLGTVMWANGMDLAPDVMYDEIKRNGVWVLR
jgi:Protein of unknown function (DUF2442)